VLALVLVIVLVIVMAVQWREWGYWCYRWRFGVDFDADVGVGVDDGVKFHPKKPHKSLQTGEFERQPQPTRAAATRMGSCETKPLLNIRKQGRDG
jgi:hypothetical protein